MKKQILQVEAELLEKNAFHYMKHLCGNIDRECEKIGEDLKNKITPQILYSVYEKNCISKTGVILDGMQILIDWSGYAGETIELETIEKAVIYFLTIGECKTEETESMLEKFYADGWKNAYLEALRAYSKEYIKKVTECEQVCDTFAPGIAGISAEEMKQFFEVLPGERIGISYWKNSMLMPEKTIAGFYFLMKGTKEYKKNCGNCIGKTEGCRYCMAGGDDFETRSKKDTIE